ncbi:MAG: hypothetical protein IMZ62_03675 [Chloroflexi bacterium]|nr:hypothetical protein [Chloroflexota bacterium]
MTRWPVEVGAPGAGLERERAHVVEVLADGPGGDGEVAVDVAGGRGEFTALVGQEFLVLGAQTPCQRLPPVLRLDGVVAEEVTPRFVQKSRHQNPPRLMLAAWGRSLFSRPTSRFQYRYFASTST